MAKGTIYGSTSQENIKVKIEWSSIPDPSTNQSSISATLYYKSTSGGVAGTGSFALTVAGSTLTYSKYVAITRNDWVEVMTYGARWSHGTDGYGTAPISATGSIADIDLVSTVEGDARLDYIPGASDITFISSLILGDDCTVKWLPTSTDYAYVLKFSLEKWEDYTEAITPKTLGEYSYSVNLSLEAANQLPNEATGTMIVSLYTYLDESLAVQVGKERSLDVTVAVPDNDSTKPTMIVSLSPNSSPFSSIYVKGRARVKAELGSASGKYGASVVSTAMSIDGKTYGEPFISDFLSSSGALDVVCTVKDSRGFVREYKRTISVIDYDTPALLPAVAESAIICARCDGDGNISESGTHLRIKARRGYSKVESGGVQYNRCAIRYRCTSSDSGFLNDEGWEDILSKDEDTDTVDVVITGLTLSVEDDYTVQVGVIDDVGVATAISFDIPTDVVVIHIPDKHKGRRIGVGRYAEDSTEAGVDMGMPIHGGGVDNLTLGELIKATDQTPVDLNDLTVPGNYYTASGEYISRSPTDGGFSLIVRELEGGGIRQAVMKGEETWLRSFDKGQDKWREWTKVITQIDTAVVADYVTESGTSKEGWVYKKWSGGSYEMHGTFDVKTSGQGGANVGGNLYRSEQFSIKLPFTVETAIMSATATLWFIPTRGELSDDNLTFYLLKHTPVTSVQEIKVSMHLFGTYQLQEE